MNDTVFTTHALACFGGAAACLILMAGLSPVTKVPPRYPEPSPIQDLGPMPYMPPGLRLRDNMEPWSALGNPSSVVLYGRTKDGKPRSLQMDDDGHVVCAP